EPGSPAERRPARTAAAAERRRASLSLDVFVFFQAVRILNVGQKRRIYDITNVLEGAGLIVKISKSMIKWLGTNQGESAHDLTKRMIKLKSQLEDLEHQEFILDQHKLWVEQSIRNTTEDCSKYPLNL
uniref:E2F/DP family winged-helix DNA-binding domain-containing protein n=1 Tax=Stegastes partitus TaxID=144197 RepID=A0A3B5A2N3_9TELE